VAVIGLAAAFFANAVSPRGLSLTRDFFGATRVIGTNAAVQSASQSNSPNLAVAAIDPVHEQVLAQLQAEGIHLAGSNQVLQLFQDPRVQQRLILFVDARDDAHYQAAHIPGAYQLDYYYPEKYLGTVLPLYQVAEQIVIYCNGGDCADSARTALFLGSAGIPKPKLLVYTGGITEWQTNGLPLEAGERGSGQITPGAEAKK